jgi:Transposase
MKTEQSDESKVMMVRSGRRGRGRYPAAARKQLLERARRRWAEGASMRVVAEELGVSVHTLSYWRAVEGISKKRAKVRRVEIVDTSPRTIVAAGPHGLRMQLTLDDAADLLRKLG